MGASEDLKAYLGPDLGRSDSDRTDRVRWVRICVCGHQEVAHAEGIGGTKVLREPEDRTVGGRPVRIIELADGCTGEMPGRYFERFTDTRSTETVGEDSTVIITRKHNPTCACDRFRPVARCDRPHRYFNQRRPSDRSDHNRHPLPTGMRAYRRRIGKLKRAQVSAIGEVWADQEFSRRFEWLDTRRCDISRCTETDDVWPVFTADDRSELRCSKHR